MADVSDEPVDEQLDAAAPRSRWRTFGQLLISVVLVGAVGGAVVIALRSRQVQAPLSEAAPLATAKVVRTTLTETEDVTGTLGYGEPRPLPNRLSGTVTSVAAEGSVVEPGQVAYTIDSAPVVLMRGPTPAYRALAPTAVGADVRQFEENLAALGYQGFTVDDRYTEPTARAVRRWQRDLHLPETGTVELGRVVFVTEPVRVARVEAGAGEVAAQEEPVLEYTSVARTVTADVDVTKRRLVCRDCPVVVTLPDRTEVAGTVAAVGTVASEGGQPAESDSAPRQQPPGDGAATATVPVTIAVADQAALGELDGAPVQVRLVSQRRENVLAVPVAALLALREGGYGVQVVEKGGTRLVAVETGAFAGGLVELVGSELAEGTEVGVARS
jgi:peptidoglycan hydrolase-like protein with peptidoglycan-binding domain